jgi:hypothetical protein
MVFAAFLGADVRPASSADDQAAQRIAAMAKRLAGARQLRVVIDCTYDVVQDSGQKVEFGERRELTLRRPDRARYEVTRRDGARRGLVFDGKQLTAFDLDQNVYASVERPGGVDAALRYFAEDLKMRTPLRELFADDLPQRLKELAADPRVVGSEAIGGILTEHIAFRGDSADVQLWIPRDGDPLPQRIVITYRRAEGQPQFAADFSQWKFDPDVSETRFTFVPPTGSEKIQFHARRGGAAEKQP